MSCRFVLKICAGRDGRREKIIKNNVKRRMKLRQLNGKQAARACNDTCVTNHLINICEMKRKIHSIDQLTDARVIFYCLFTALGDARHHAIIFVTFINRFIYGFVIFIETRSPKSDDDEKEAISLTSRKYRKYFVNSDFW